MCVPLSLICKYSHVSINIHKDLATSTITYIKLPVSTLIVIKVPRGTVVVTLNF